MICVIRLIHRIIFCNLKHHLKNSHLLNKVFPCSECNYKANTKKSLEVHIKSVHRKLKDLVCQECSKARGWHHQSYADWLVHNMQIWYVMPLSGLPCYIIFWFAVLYLFLDGHVISSSGLQIYTYVWFASLYLFLL